MVLDKAVVSKTAALQVKQTALVCQTHLVRTGENRENAACTSPRHRGSILTLSSRAVKHVQKAMDLLGRKSIFCDIKCPRKFNDLMCSSTQQYTYIHYSPRDPDVLQHGVRREALKCLEWLINIYTCL